MKKIFFQITVLLCLTGSAWGQSIEVTPVQIQCHGETTGKIIVDVQGIIDYPITIRVTRRGMDPPMEKLILDEPVEPIVFDVPPHNTNGYTVSVVEYPALSENDIYIYAITIPELVIIGAPVLGVDCPDRGKITVGAGGGTPPYLFVIAPNDEPEKEKEFVPSNPSIPNSNTFTDLSRDTVYNVFIKDANGCTSNIVEGLEFQEYIPLDVSVDKEPISVTCNGSEDGEVRIIVDGGTAPIWFELNGVSPWQKDNLFDELEPGPYFVTVYDDDGWGCIETITFSVVEPPVVTVEQYTANPPSCPGGDDGSITDLVAEGGSGKGYLFSISSDGIDNWSEWQSSFSGMTGGVTCFVKAKDDNGCESLPVSVTIPNPPEVSFTLTKTDPGCASAATGSITISKPSYPNDLHPSYEDLELEYQILEKVEKEDEEAVYEPVPEYDGFFKLEELVNDAFTDLKAGTYTVTGKIAGRNCAPFTAEITLTDPNAVLVHLQNISNVSCFDGSDGRITLTVDGGVSGGFLTTYYYSYSYRYSENGEDNWTDWSEWTVSYIPMLNLPAGVYEIKGRQTKLTALPPSMQHLCESEIVRQVITQPEELVVRVTPIHTICFDGIDGKIAVEIEGGTPYETGAPYRYRYSTTANQNIFPIPNLDAEDNSFVFEIMPPMEPPVAAGTTYYVYVRDANNCRANADATVKTALKIEADIVQTPEPAICYTDANNVTLTVINVISEPDRDLEYYIKKSGESWGEPNTDIPANVFSNLGEEGNTAYDIRIKYAIDGPDVELSSCPLDIEYTVIIPPMIEFEFTDSTSIRCHNGHGAIEVTAQGGHPDAAFWFGIDRLNGAGMVWVELGKDENVYEFTGLGGDTAFIFNVKKVYDEDDPGCFAAEQTKMLANPDELVFSLIYPEDKTARIDCPNEDDSEIKVSAEGGTGSLSYSLYMYDFEKDEYELFRGPQSSGEFTGLDSATYKVKVTDVNFCSDSIFDVVITRPKKIEFSVSEDLIMLPCEAATATVKLNVTSSDPVSSFVFRVFKEAENGEWEPYVPYDDWDTYNDAAGFTIPGSDTGDFKVEMAYGMNCSVNDSAKFTVEIDDTYSITAIGQPNQCAGGKVGWIEITASLPGGEVTYELYRKPDKDSQDSEYLKIDDVFDTLEKRYWRLTGGYYKVMVHVGDCTFEDEVDLADPDPLVVIVLTTFSPCTDRPSDTSGKLIFQAEGGVPGQPGNVYLYELYTEDGGLVKVGTDTGRTGEFSGLSSTNYWIRVEDFNKNIEGHSYPCATKYLPLPFDNHILEVTEPVKAFFDEDTIHVSCKGYQVDELIVNVENGRVIKTYKWDPAANDGEGALTLDMTVRESVSYKWEYRYDENSPWEEWTNYQDSVAHSLIAGEYKVTVTDDVCGSIDEAFITITEPDALTIELAEKGTFPGYGHISCNGETDGFIIVETKGGTMPYKYTITKDEELYEPDPAHIRIIPVTDENDGIIGDTLIITGLGAGDYMIEIIDNNECASVSLSQPVTIKEPPALSVTAIGKDAKCHDVADGSVIVSVIGGTAPYTIKVFDGDDEEDEMLDKQRTGILSGSTVVIPDFSGGVDQKSYRVVVEDVNGCTQEKTVIINNPDETAVTLTVEENVCPPGTAGKLNVTTTDDGSGSYTWYYLDEDGDGVEIVDPLFDPEAVEAGKYFVGYIDVNHCSTVLSDTVEVLKYEELGYTGIITYPEVCDVKGSVRIVEPVGGISGDNGFEYRVFDVDKGEYIHEEFGSFANDSITGLSEGNYYIFMRHNRTDVCPLMAPLQLEAPNPISIGSLSAIDVGNPSDWFETEDPLCFNGKGKITVKNPISSTVEDVQYRITDKDGDDVAELSWKDNNVEYDGLPVGEYTLWIYDMEHGCEEKTDFAIGEDLPVVQIENISNGLVGYNCEDEGYIEFDVSISNDASGLLTPDVSCINADNEEAPFTITQYGSSQKWKYYTTLNRDGKWIIRAATGGCFVKDSIDITFPGEIILEHDYAGIGDCASTTAKVTFTVSGGSGDFIFSITTVDGNVVPDGLYSYILGKGKYTAKVVDTNNGCTVVKDLEITLPENVDVNMVTPDIKPETCEGKNDGYIKLSSGEDYTYKWDKAGNDGLPVESSDLTGLTAGTYWVTIYNSSGKCSDRHSYDVPVANTVEVTITGNGNGAGKDEYCPDAQAILTGKVVINNVEMTSVLTDVSAFWTLPGGDTPDFLTNNPLQLPAANAKVQLAVSLMAGTTTCQGNATLDMKIMPTPTLVFPADTIYIPQDELYDLRVEASGFESCTWTATPPSVITTQGLPCPPATVSLVSPDVPYDLTLVVKNEHGCTASGSIYVDHGIDLFIPNVFTPNEDGNHDTWMFRNIERYTGFYEIQVEVFTRNGMLVYEGKGYNNSSVVWKGQRQGQDLPIGTYWYVVKLVPKSSSGKTQILNGSVNIIR